MVDWNKMISTFPTRAHQILIDDRFTHAQKLMHKVYISWHTWRDTRSKWYKNRGSIIKKKKKSAIFSSASPKMYCSIGIDSNCIDDMYFNLLSLIHYL